MPKRLVCSAVGEVAWQEYEERRLGSGEVRVAFEYGTEKHGTMMAFYKGYANERGRWDVEARMHRPEGVLWAYPIPLGNQQVGVVTELGPEVKHLQLGDRVFFHCGFQPTAITHEDSCWKLPEGVAWQSALMEDPCEFAVGAVRDGNVRVGDRVAVFGMGAIGLAAVQVAKAAGCALVAAVDVLDNRLAAAKACGADLVLDARATADVGLALREATGMVGMDVAIDFSGSRQALQAAVRGVGYLGTIVCGAFPPPYDGGLDFGGEAHMNRPRIVFSRACSDPNPDHPRWDWTRVQSTCLELITRGLIDGKPILDPIIPYASLLDEYPKIAKDPGSNIKLTVRY